MKEREKRCKAQVSDWGDLADTVMLFTEALWFLFSCHKGVLIISK